MLRWVIIGDRMGIGKAVEFFREMALKHLTKAEIAEAERRAASQRGSRRMVKSHSDRQLNVDWKDPDEGRAPQ